MVRTGVSLKKISILVALAVLAVAVVAGAGSFALVLAGIWGLVTFCLGYTRGVRKNATAQPQIKAGFRHNLCVFGAIYLIPIGIATTFYVALSCYISRFGNSLSIDSLIAIQQAFEDFSQFFSDKLKLNEIEIFVVLVVIYLLSCVLLSKPRQSNTEAGAAAGAGRGLRFQERVVTMLHRAVDVYGKYSGPAAAGVATLASFTLFGMQLGEPAKDLQLRVKVIQVGYAEVAKRTEAELSERVTTALYTKIGDTFPSSYRDALRLPTQIDGLVKSVQQHADDAKSKYEVSVPTVERTLQDEKARIREVDELKSDLRIEGTGRRTVPGSTTYNQVEAARNALGSRREDRRIELISEGQKKITLQVEKIVGEQIMMLTKPLTNAIPILEPLMQTFVEATDRTLQERIGKSYDHAMETAMRNPRDLAAVVEREAKVTVAETDIETLVEHATPRAQQQSEKLKQTLSSLTDSKSLIDHHVTENLTARQSMQNCRGCLKLLPLPDLHLLRVPDLYRSPYLYRPPGTGNFDWPGRITTPRPVVPKPVMPKPVVPEPKVPRFFFW
jgi:hypothetical protein